MVGWFLFCFGTDSGSLSGRPERPSRMWVRGRDQRAESYRGPAPAAVRQGYGRRAAASGGASRSGIEWMYCAVKRARAILESLLLHACAL